MAIHNIKFHPSAKTVSIPTGVLLTEALRQAGLEIAQPCGGQGRCGRCAVVLESGTLRRRSTIRLTAADVEANYVLACQSVIDADAVILVPEQEKIERRLVTDKTPLKVAAPFAYDAGRDQTVRTFPVTLPPPSLVDATDDMERLERALAFCGVHNLDMPLPMLRELGACLRESPWQATAVIETDNWRQPKGPPRLIDLVPGVSPFNVYGLAIDIGTTTVSVTLVDLASGDVLDSAAEYNGQIARGEDVISRIIYAGKNDGLGELGVLVRDTINEVIHHLCQDNHIQSRSIYKATIVGNTTMMHLFLGLQPASIRLAPYVPTINNPLPLRASEVGLDIHPMAAVDCLPGVASYVGADITAGVLSSELAEAQGLTLFIDVGTNGEIVLGTQDWLVTCACSAGPAFEGAGVVCGMRATHGAIEEVWVNPQTFEPTYRVIDVTKPKGLCGSGLISLLAELFITGAVDKSGRFKMDLGTPRIREGEHGGEYVVAWAGETATGNDIVLTTVDIDNLMRAKAAIYGGFTVLAQSVGTDLADVERVLIGGSFGKHLNVEKAVQIGLLPDMPWDRFHFLGNTAVFGAYQALLSRSVRAKIKAIAKKMTYVELSADNSFYEAFISALFLPHTDLAKFPMVAALWDKNRSAVPEGSH